MRSKILFGLFFALTGCIEPVVQSAPKSVSPGPASVSRVDTAVFAQVASRVEPIAERICSNRTKRLNCDFQIAIDSRKGQPANAYQSVNKNGRPVIAFTVALIGDAKNADELAFIMGHEAAHHIAGHLPKTQESAMAGAVLGGILASIAGADAGAIDAAQNIGARVGVQRFSKGFELEADQLGTLIAYRAGYDPLRGAQYFTRIPDPGNGLLSTHPPNADRIKTVRREMARIR